MKNKTSAGLRPEVLSTKFEIPNVKAWEVFYEKQSQFWGG